MASPLDLAGTPMMLLVEWFCVFAFLALIVELFLGALNLIDRLRRR